MKKNNLIQATLFTLLVTGTASATTMFDTLKKEYLNEKNVPATYDIFQRVGDNIQNCIAVDKNEPDIDHYIGMYLFVRSYAQRGPLFPAITINKILVNLPVNSETMDTTFTNVVMTENKAYLESDYTIDKNNYTKTYLKMRDDLIYFGMQGKENNVEFIKYGYCYPY